MDDEHKANFFSFADWHSDKKLNDPTMLSQGNTMEISVAKKYESYPDNAKIFFMKIRAVIFEVAENEGLGDVEETLKWGEPSYLVKGGSTIRVDWKPKFPNQLSVYFNCKTSLVETFREIFGDTFQYEGNREIVFLMFKKLPLTEFKTCISLSFRYHKIKNLPLLGM
jgi:Domain of unknown function (DU1801)